MVTESTKAFTYVSNCFIQKHLRPSRQRIQPLQRFSPGFHGSAPASSSNSCTEPVRPVYASCSSFSSCSSSLRSRFSNSVTASLSSRFSQHLIALSMLLFPPEYPNVLGGHPECYSSLQTAGVSENPLPAPYGRNHGSLLSFSVRFFNA